MSTLRRTFLAHALRAAAAGLMAGRSLDLQAAQAEHGRLGELLGTVPFVGEGRVAVGERVGPGIRRGSPSTYRR